MKGEKAKQSTVTARRIEAVVEKVKLKDVKSDFNKQLEQ